ncbi:phosphonopyruvate decarboxylase [Kibdelosporangium aridum]|uniref:Phosphonopyruvate decarboxylase n=2 Tax=Pseudonocardiaceae TaxID=2070 RepID=A0A428YQJ6_KIBAR|nr:phosphonopyruvate decarboxylase [Kibdelosporangium aridum]RSM70811.1 phosphonopyruvate decarboxylase [Kibdelosporangium aridum]CAB45023.1 putative phosphonopyruvate decarboxylase [Amycolatopsis orientalis]
MIGADEFAAALLDQDYQFFSGVPCSRLAGVTSILSSHEGRYVPAANEGAALAIAAGARMAGTRAAVLIQNSGLGNMVNPLTSLVLPYEIPVLVVVSLRGWPVGTDEPQHNVMGKATKPMADLCGMPSMVLEPSLGSLAEALASSQKAEMDGKPFCLLVPKGTVKSADPAPTPSSGVLSRVDAVRIVSAQARDAAIYSTTGYTSRELFAAADRPGNFYMQGSMGHALALGLGSALRRPDRRVVVLDGDGAALMHMGTMSTVGNLAPANLLHVVLDNGTYGSTGSQPTTSATVDWPALARANGYRDAWLCADGAELQGVLGKALTQPGPCLVAVRIRASETDVPPRASAELPLPGIRNRFEHELAVGPGGQMT